MKKEAYNLLLYFSSVILLSKVLVMFDIIHINGALETAIPAAFKNLVSFLYHGFVIYYLMKKDVRPVFLPEDLRVEAEELH